MLLLRRGALTWVEEAPHRPRLHLARGNQEIGAGPRIRFILQETPPFAIRQVSWSTLAGRVKESVDRSQVLLDRAVRAHGEDRDPSLIQIASKTSVPMKPKELNSQSVHPMSEPSRQSLR